MKITVPENAQRILSKSNIEQKIKRMSYEILELHYQADEIIILGIEGGGVHLANLIADSISQIRDIKTTTNFICINKKDPYSQKPFIRKNPEQLAHKHIIIVDDVGNSGSTLFHAIQAVYDIQPKSLHMAVLIDRTHKKFPIKADIIGTDLATTLTEHIHVVFHDNGEPEGAYIY